VVVIRGAEYTPNEHATISGLLVDVPLPETEADQAIGSTSVPLHSPAATSPEASAGGNRLLTDETDE
jgi:hypothetical protein